MTTLSALLPQMTVGDPDVAGRLAVFPLTGPLPRLEYISYAAGARRGVTVQELPAASVNDLLTSEEPPMGRCP